MTAMQTVKRKILLKRQAVQLINADIRELRFRENLLKMKAHLENQQKAHFDPMLSHNLECVVFLLENLK